MDSTHKTRQSTGRKLQKLWGGFSVRGAEPLEMCRLASVPNEGEARPRRRRGRRLRQLSDLARDEVGATWWRAASAERNTAKDDVDRGRRGRRVVGVRETQVVQVSDVRKTQVVQTGDVVRWPVTQPTQLTYCAITSLDRVHLKHAE